MTIHAVDATAADRAVPRRRLQQARRAPGGRRGAGALTLLQFLAVGAGLAAGWTAGLGGRGRRGHGRPAPWCRSSPATSATSACTSRSGSPWPRRGFGVAIRAWWPTRPVASRRRPATSAMRFSRRDFFGMTGGAGLVAATASLGLLTLGPTSSTGTELRSEVPLPQPFSRPLTLPPIARADRPGPTSYRLTARAANAEIHSRAADPDLGLRRAVPRSDDPAPGRAGRSPSTVVNELPVPTVVHLHGGRTPAEYDGYPTDLILPAARGRLDRPRHHGRPSVGRAGVSISVAAAGIHPLVPRPHDGFHRPERVPRTGRVLPGR